eukprot:CAMPEP_0167749694 /NCGR_PEP_ID=MMETSP0110_2-20121227/5562_1 /TAXON_ID=629695 /ORGANISM="Gymnochlora sp., Strain CCMP2014" /LENGTH=427 /DNA_ID=CAMNT_0007634901 /DNA_START=459 /DNA_END=1739 /DNA_ORIENTATION=-
MSFGETLHRPALRTSERDRRCSQRANLQMSSILGIVLISVCALFIPNSSKRRLGYSPEPVVEGASRWSSERRTLPEHMLQRRGHKGFRPIFDSFTSAVGGGISGRPAYESTRDATRTGKAFAKAGGASGDAVSNKSTSRTTRGRPGDMDDKDDKKQGFRMKKTLELTPIEILYLIPGHVCVVNKPPDVFIEKCKGNEGVTAIDMTKEALKQKGYDHSYFHFINRLDFATSGVMVFGLSRIAAGVGTECFANRRARKVYVAIVEGHVPESWDRGIYIDSPLAQSPKSDFLQVLGSESNPGKTCLTQVLAVQRGTLGNEKVSKVLIWIRSGRRHQIRVHLSKAGHPIVGDATYGAGYPLANSSRMALHAWKLSMDLRSSTRNQRKRKNEDAQKFGPVAVEAKDPFKSMIQPMKDSNEKKQLELSERLKW